MPPSQTDGKIPVVPRHRTSQSRRCQPRHRRPLTYHGHGPATHLPFNGRAEAFNHRRRFVTAKVLIASNLSLGSDTRRAAQRRLTRCILYAQRVQCYPITFLTVQSAPLDPNSRRARSATALRQLTSLQSRRAIPAAGGLARGNFPSGQMARRAPRSPNSSSGAVADGEAGDGPAPPRFAKFAARPTTAQDTALPDGQMPRGPGQLKISRTPVGGNSRGPNLGGRSAGRGGPRGSTRAGSGGREQRPKKRERKAGGNTAKESNLLADTDPSTTLSDGMVHHLLRLQRKEWDRVPYEPKYAMGSLAANQLIHEGRELFRGESAPVKIWGRLEKRIGVVGMFGAEAHLKIRRVPDGDEAPFGKEEADEVVIQEESRSDTAVR